jgi:hypothetical protein
MKAVTNISVVLSFLIFVIIFLIFTGGAITMKIMSNKINKNGMMNGSSWMWIPIFVCFFLSALLSYIILF